MKEILWGVYVLISIPIGWKVISFFQQRLIIFATISDYLIGKLILSIFVGVVVSPFVIIYYVVKYFKNEKAAIIAVIISVILSLLFVAVPSYKKTSSNIDNMPLNAVTKTSNGNNKIDIPTSTPISNNLGEPMEIPNTEPISQINNETRLNELIQDYEKAMVEAINEGDFSIVSHYIIKDSPLFYSQQKLVSDLQKKNINEELLGCEIKSITPLSPNNYDVKVFERFNILYGDGSKKYKEFYYTYSVTLEPEPGLSNIR